MTQEQIERGRIAIAERCGIKVCWPHEWHYPRIKYFHPDAGREPQYRTADCLECRKCKKQKGMLIADAFELPNYHNSLDAMHEAEKSLDKETNRLNEAEGEETEFDGYLWNLERVVLETCDEESCYGGCITATAPQRFEAFLKTIGKWEE